MGGDDVWGNSSCTQDEKVRKLLIYVGLCYELIPSNW